jgi:hypothetical protein
MADGDNLPDLVAHAYAGASAATLKQKLAGVSSATISAYANAVDGLRQNVDSTISTLNTQGRQVFTAFPTGNQLAAQNAKAQLDGKVASLQQVSTALAQYADLVRQAADKARTAEQAYRAMVGNERPISQAMSQRRTQSQGRAMAANSRANGAQGIAAGQAGMNNSANPLGDLIKSLTGAGSGSSTPAPAAPAPAAPAPTAPAPTAPATANGYPYGGTAIDPTTGLPVHGIQISVHADGSFDVTSTGGVDPTTGLPIDQTADITVLTQDPTTHQTQSHQVHIGSDGTGTVVS